jgi:hypothetical protein
MRRYLRLARIDALLFASALALLGCADDRMPLEECTYARYWADCTGNTESTADPVVGCDAATGHCRWFRGGVTARGHVVSDCPPDDLCCHGTGAADITPFESWSPGGAVRAQAQHDVSLLVAGVLGPEGAYDVAVVYDYVGVPDRALVTCTGSPPGIPCGIASGPYPYTRRVGDALLFELGGVGPPLPYLEIEIFPAGGAEARARVYTHNTGPIDGPDPLCNPGWGGRAMPLTGGTLHLSTDAVDDLVSLHGRFEGVTEMGTFAIEF